jgi:hypothetical protein
VLCLRTVLHFITEVLVYKNPCAQKIKENRKDGGKGKKIVQNGKGDKGEK